METVLVVKNAAYGVNTAGTPAVIADSSKINTLADGTIVAITPSGKVVPAAGFTSAITDEFFQLVLKTSEGLLRSPLIQRTSLAYVKEAYIAPVEKIETLDFTGAFATAPTNHPGGKSAGISIKPFVYVTPLDDKDYEFFDVAIHEGDSVGNAVTKLVAAINAGSKYVTAAVTATTKITLTGKAGLAFEGAGMYEFETYTRSVGTQFVAGHGLSHIIAEQELRASAHKGNGRYKSYNEQLYSQQMQTEKGKHYDTINFSWKKEKMDQLNSNDAPYNQLGMVAGVAGAALTAIDKIFETANA